MRSRRGSPDAPLAALLAGALLAACTAPEAPASYRLAAFGTLVTLTLHAPLPADADDVVSELEAHYRQREIAWYPWADGELARLNAALAAGGSAEVSPELAALLERARALEAASDGWFNPALGALSELWGFDDVTRDDWRPPDPAAVAAVLAGSPAAARLEIDGQRVSAASRAVLLDLGGIAKGALLAETAARLAARGVANAVVDLGGDLLVLGQPPGRRARIGIRNPAGGDVLGWVEAGAGEAVLTSGDYERYFEYAGQRYAHVLDPTSGRPAAGTASVTVVHRDPVVADAAATALLAAGAAHFDALVASLGLDFALLVTASGDLRLTPAMAGRVHWLSRPPPPGAT